MMKKYTLVPTMRLLLVSVSEAIYHVRSVEKKAGCARQERGYL